jgi:hypothetical protein
VSFRASGACLCLVLSPQRFLPRGLLIHASPSFLPGKGYRAFRQKSATQRRTGCDMGCMEVRVCFKFVHVGALILWLLTLCSTRGRKRRRQVRPKLKARVQRRPAERIPSALPVSAAGSQGVVKAKVNASSRAGIRTASIRVAAAVAMAVQSIFFAAG